MKESWWCHKCEERNEESYDRCHCGHERCPECSTTDPDDDEDEDDENDMF